MGFWGLLCAHSSLKLAKSWQTDHLVLFILGTPGASNTLLVLDGVTGNEWTQIHVGDEKGRLGDSVHVCDFAFWLWVLSQEGPLTFLCL